MDLVPRIYHETQESDSQMCGQHALNNLLQGRYFQPTDMAEIAQQLDEEENAELDEDRRISVNMDDSGFFSVQVLDRCLQVWNLSLDRWRSEDMADKWDKPEEQEAYILNLQSHWFCLRRFGQKSERWYNLNSFFPSPQWISGTYLSMVIKSAEDEGYSVFVIRPLTPQSPASLAAGESILPNTSADEVAARLGPPNRETNSSSSSFKGTGQRLGGDGGAGFSGAASGGDFEDEDAAFQAALAASMVDTSPGTPSSFSNNQPPAAAAPAVDDPVALSLARSQARLQQFQREQAAALRGDFDMDLEGFGGAGGAGGGGFGGYAAAVASGNGSGSRSGLGRSGGLGTQGTSRSGNVPQVDERTEASGSSRRPRRQGDPSALHDDDDRSPSSSASGSGSNSSRPVAALPARQQQRTRHDEDEEQMRRAIEASLRDGKQRERAEAREARRLAMAVDGEEDNEEDEDEEDEDDEPVDNDDEGEELDQDDDDVETFSLPPSPHLAQAQPPPPLAPSSHHPSSFLGDDDDFGGPQQQHGFIVGGGGDRDYDDEDAELQRALKASMEGLPDGWTTSPAAPRPAVPAPALVPGPGPTAAAAGSTSTTTATGGDAEEKEEEKEEEEEVLSPEEIRRRRLARFA